MRSIRTNLSVPVLLLTLALVGVIAVQSYALGRASPRPTVVAVVNLEKLYEGLAERAEEDERLSAIARELQDQIDIQVAEIGVLEEDVQVYPVGSDKYEEVVGKLQFKSLDHQAFTEFSRRKMDVQHAVVLKRIYLSIKDAAAVMAMEQGYDLFFVDDSLAALPDGTEAEVRRQISARRMLYSNPEIDVTTELIARMNEAFAAR